MNRGKAKKLTAVARKLTLERFCNEDMLPANHSGTADPTDLSLPIDLEIERRRKRSKKGKFKLSDAELRRLPMVSTAVH